MTAINENMAVCSQVSRELPTYRQDFQVDDQKELMEYLAIFEENGIHN